MSSKFYLCEHCKNLVGMINNSGVPIICCGAKMKSLEANTVEASHEKHIPMVLIEGQKVSVTVGSVVHPMTEEHYIDWIYLETSEGGMRKKCNGKPSATFTLDGEEPIAVYAYCNLHGLWKTEL
ncbi:MAG: desulfoferrodoxin family protein [Clostridia bacterium]